MVLGIIARRLDDVMEFRDSLNPESDRGCALMAAAFLDAELDLLLRQCIVDSRVAEDIFGQSRPLSTFSARIDLAFLLGLIDGVTHRDLHLIRKIRNDFGHVHAPLSFGEKAIAARCRELKVHFRSEDAEPRKIFISSAVAALAIIHTAMHKRERISERATPNLENVREKVEAITETMKAAFEAGGPE